MKLVVKLGGTLLDDPRQRASLARQLAWLSAQCQLAVVHGGGKQVTRFLEERGVKSRFIGGLRVSDETVIDAVTRVIAGGVNKQLVAALAAAGVRAAGISGVDGGLIHARPLSPEFQFTGQPTQADSALLDTLIAGGFLPVVACIAGDDQGHIYNVNADQLAVACAASWGAQKLFFLTDVTGVRSASGEIIATLDPAEIQRLIASGVATGGMQAKLEASVHALHSGVEEIVIVSGQTPDICQSLFNGRFAGTTITHAV